MLHFINEGANRLSRITGLADAPPPPGERQAFVLGGSDAGGRGGETGLTLFPSLY